MVFIPAVPPPPDFVFGGKSNASVAWLKDRNDALQISRDAVVAAQARQALYADRGREPSNLQVGDPVLVFRDFLLYPEARQQPSRKLQQKWFGPYRILAKIGSNAYRLELPPGHRYHPVFNVTALRRYEENAISGREQPPPPSFTDLDGNERFMVERILNGRTHGGRQQSLVHWKGYPVSQAT